MVFMGDFASRAGLKLDHAMQSAGIDPAGWTCADLGSNAGGFVDCLLQRGAARVYAIDTGYGMLDYRLRIDPRVVVMERTNAMHAAIPEPVRLITIDVAWTRQRHILPAARRLLGADGQVITLIKPHYESDRRRLSRGVLPEEQLEPVLQAVRGEIITAGFEILDVFPSPIKGGKGNREFLAWLKPAGR